MGLLPESVQVGDSSLIRGTLCVLAYKPTRPVGTQQSAGASLGACMHPAPWTIMEGDLVLALCSVLPAPAHSADRPRVLTMLESFMGRLRRAGDAHRQCEQRTGPATTA